MMEAGMCRKVYAALVAAAMVFQAPVAWAQLADIDPALHAAVEALVTSDPEVASDPELADLCRTIAEATVTDPRERAAVTGEVVEMAREGVDVKSIIPQEVRDAAREQFTKVQGEMQEKLEALRAENPSDPRMGREMELMMREGERQMVAFEAGERYTPSREMVAHAETMMKEWETDMAAHGAPPEYIERARGEFAAWSSGETNPAEMMAMGHEMMAAGGLGGTGEMPSLEQMEQMVAAGQMTPEQLQMASEFMQQGGFEAMQHSGFETYGINPSTGGWEPNMAGGAAMGGWEVGYTGPYGFEGGSNYGVNPATGGWEPGMGGTAYTGGMEAYTAGMEAYTAGMEAYQAMEQQYHEYIPMENQVYDNTQAQLYERTESVNHVGHLVDHDNNVGTPDQVHVHEIHVHTDATRHDHTTPGSGL